MAKLEDIEKAISQISAAIAQLSVEDLAKLRDWLDEFDSRMINEEDRAGRQDRLQPCAVAQTRHAGRLMRR